VEHNLNDKTQQELNFVQIRGDLMIVTQQTCLDNYVPLNETTSGAAGMVIGLGSVL
jgi:hypothetical protein